MTTYEPESMWLISPSPGLIHTLFFALAPDPSRNYVDLGCSHPVNKSLTAFVRDLGWRGLAVDGNPDYQKDWDEAGFGKHFRHAILSWKTWQKARFAIHDNSFTSRISESVENDRPEMWGINRVIEEYPIPLEELLTAHQIEKIDLLCVDLEGAEYHILKTLDFEKHQPSFIISEYVTHGEGIDPRVCRMLLDRGYEVIHMTESNLIYRRK